MALKDRFRRALSRSDNRSSPSSISTTSTTHSPPHPSSTHTNSPSTRPTLPRATTTPSTSATPTLTLTKTSSRLSRMLTGGRGADKKRDTEVRRLEEWARQDEKEWESPSKKYPGKKSMPHQETLRAFEWRWRGSMDRRRSSAYSGVSPSASRNGSVDDSALPTLSRVLSGGSARRRSSHGPSERGGSRGGDGQGHGHGAHVETVVEE